MAVLGVKIPGFRVKSKRKFCVEVDVSVFGPFGKKDCNRLVGQIFAGPACTWSLIPSSSAEQRSKKNPRNHLIF